MLFTVAKSHRQNEIFSITMCNLALGTNFHTLKMESEHKLVDMVGVADVTPNRTVVQARSLSCCGAAFPRTTAVVVQTSQEPATDSTVSSFTGTLLMVIDFASFAEMRFACALGRVLFCAFRAGSFTSVVLLRRVKCLSDGGSLDSCILAVSWPYLIVARVCPCYV